MSRVRRGRRKLGLLLLGWVASVAAAPSLLQGQRLFTTAAERARIDATGRDQSGTEPGPVPATAATPPKESLPRLRGILRRPDGRFTVWLDDRRWIESGPVDGKAGGWQVSIEGHGADLAGRLHDPAGGRSRRLSPGRPLRAKPEVEHGRFRD